MKHQLFYFGVLPGLFIQLVSAYLYFIVFKEESFAQTLYFVSKVLILVWPLLWILYAKKIFPKMFGGDAKQSLLFGLATGLLILMVLSFTYLVSVDLLISYSENFRTKAEELNFLEHYILFSLFLSVVHSLLEEYYWRWFILNGLILKMSHIRAAVVSSLAFASHHFIILSQFFPLGLSILGTLSIFAAGLLWCGISIRTKSILGSWLSHFFADLGVMGAGYFLLF